DPAGLQAALRQAGLRATVTFATDRCVNAGFGPDTRIDRMTRVAWFTGDLSTFHEPYTWQRLFAGSPPEVISRNTVVALTDGRHRLHRFATGRHFTFTVHPHALPSGDVVNIGFAHNRSLLVDVEKLGTPLQCAPPRAATR